MSISSWQSTALFKHLKKQKGRHAENMVSLLKNPRVLDKIQQILAKAGTTPKDFTLHDDGHSYRVAERMWELIPVATQKKLSAYELGLLLLSAYLHDIGMSPDFKKVEEHKKYLTTKVKKGLSEDEINEFQKWIDNDVRTISINIRKEKVEDTKVANYILTHFIRYRHNDWSGEWIKNNLADIILEDYPFWVDDLIKICKSHHYGLDVLKGEDYAPKPIGRNSTVHLRYLSMCLRVADVMENDPERTPEVILQHRDISEDSITYWLKDQRFTLNRSKNKFTIYSRPERAYLHKAIDETANQIENELKLCSELIKIKPLYQSSFAELKDYEWVIEPYLHRDIAPRDNSYEYIQGAFRPNTTKILELLGGSQLYGDSIWAYRELIQNAIDAVKEKIAYFITNENKNPKEYSRKLGELFSIDIILEEREDGVWLICRDQGVGMTKNIIEKYFLESGSTKRHEISELERKCEQQGFNFERIAQFGIGVLSYFMIAEKIIVKTKREFNTGYADEESIGWKFEINGTHDFGELSKYKKTISGTQIELKLKKDVVKTISSWDDKFCSFLKTEIAKTPCNITYTSSVSKKVQKVTPGWTNQAEDIVKDMVENFAKDATSKIDYEDRFIPSFRKNVLLKYNLLAKEAVVEIPQKIDFLFEEGEIEGLGSYRIYIPYFKLIKGNCFYFLKEQVQGDDHRLFKINSGYFWFPNWRRINFNLRGIRIEQIKVEGSSSKHLPLDRNILSIIPNAHIEINLETFQDSTLSVSRKEIMLGKSFISYKALIDSKINDLINAHKNLFENCYSSLNVEITGSALSNDYWVFSDQCKSENNDSAYLLWKKIKFPVCSSHYIFYTNQNVSFRNKSLTIINSLYGIVNHRRSDWFREIEGNYQIGVYLLKNARPILIPILDVNPSLADKKSFNFINIELPEEWSNIVLLRFSYDLDDKWYINVNSKYFKLFDSSIMEQLANIDNVKAKKDLVGEKYSFALLIHSLIKHKEESWIGLCEKKKSIYQQVFKHLETSSVYLYVSDSVVKVTLDSWKGASAEEIKKVMPLKLSERYFLKVEN